MKRFIVTVVIVLLVSVVAVGFYRGWFTLSSRNPEAGSNKVNVNLTMDRDKIQDDARAVEQKTSELVEKVSSGANEPGDQAKDSK